MKAWCRMKHLQCRSEKQGTLIGSKIKEWVKLLIRIPKDSCSMAYVTTFGLNFIGHVGKYSSIAYMDSIDICESLLANEDFMEWNEVLLLADCLLLTSDRKLKLSMNKGVMASWLCTSTLGNLDVEFLPPNLPKVYYSSLITFVFVKPEVCRFYVQINVAHNIYI